MEQLHTARSNVSPLLKRVRPVLTCSIHHPITKYSMSPSFLSLPTSCVLPYELQNHWKRPYLINFTQPPYLSEGLKKYPRGRLLTALRSKFKRGYVEELEVYGCIGCWWTSPLAPANFANLEMYFCSWTAASQGSKEEIWRDPCWPLQSEETKSSNWAI